MYTAHPFLGEYLAAGLAMAYLVLLGILAFRLINRFSSKTFAWIDLPVASSLACFAIILFGVLLELSGLRSLNTLSVIVHLSLLVSLFALFHAGLQVRLGKLPQLIVAPGVWILAGIWVVSLFFWFYSLRDLSGLPSDGDGTAHALITIRILESKHIFLSAAKRHFEFFGQSHYTFYPSFTHALVAVFLKPFIGMGLMTVGQALKGVLILCNSLMPILAAYTIHRFLRNGTMTVLVLSAIASFLQTRIPMTATDSGGFPRIFAYFLVFPVTAYILTAKLTAQQLAVWALVSLPPLSMLHPGAFVLMAFSIGFRSVVLLAQTPGRRLKLKFLGTLALSGAGAALLVKVMFDFAMNSVDKAMDPRYLHMLLPWQTHHIEVRLIDYFAFAFGDLTYPMGLAPRVVLLIIGSLSLIYVAVIRREHRSTAIFTLTLTLVGLGFYFLVFVPNPSIRNAGLIFYFDAFRIGEMLFTPQVVLLGFGMATLLSLVKTGQPAPGIGLTLRRMYAPFIVFLLVGALGYDLNKGSRSTLAYLAQQNEKYQSPRYTEFQALIHAVKTKTPKNAVIIADTYLGNRIYPATGRRSFFIYHECPFGLPDPNCEQRFRFFDQLKADLAVGMQAAQQTETCVKQLAIFNKPVYLTLSEYDYPQLGKCRDLEVMGAYDGFQLVRVLLDEPHEGSQTQIKF